MIKDTVWLVPTVIDILYTHMEYLKVLNKLSDSIRITKPISIL